MTEANKTLIKVAHSPDSDDAFMFYAITEKKIDLGSLDYYFGSSEIENLNQLALTRGLESHYDVIAVSFHAYAYLHKQFQILRAGASLGSPNHGPKVVASKRASNIFSETKSINGFNIAIPGAMTSANLCLNIYTRERGQTINPIYCSFNEVFKLLEDGVVGAALLIHESQLQYEQHGYELILDLGKWWAEYSGGLNLPLGTNVIKRSIAKDIRKQVADQLSNSIKYGKEHFIETSNYARVFSQNGLDDENAKKYLDMYVNESTKELTPDDIRSVKLFYSAAQKHNLIDVQEEIPLDLI